MGWWWTGVADRSRDTGVQESEGHPIARPVSSGWQLNDLHGSHPASELVLR